MTRGEQDHADALRIRPFQAGDQAEVRTLILSALAENFGAAFDPAANPDVDDIMADYVEMGHPFYIGETDGRTVASGGLLMRGRGVAQVIRIAVNPACRRRGFARAMIGHLVGVARDAGMRRVIVECNTDWRRAVALYERCGFAAYDHDDVSTYLAMDLETK